MKAPPQKIFALVDLHHGKVQNWSRTTVTSDLVDALRQIYRMTYATTLSTGGQQSSEAHFRVAERREPNYLELHREGLESKSLNNELLKIVFDIEAAAGGLQADHEILLGAAPAHGAGPRPRRSLGWRLPPERRGRNRQAR